MKIIFSTELNTSKRVALQRLKDICLQLHNIPRSLSLSHVCMFSFPIQRKFEIKIRTTFNNFNGFDCVTEHLDGVEMERIFKRVSWEFSFKRGEGEEDGVGWDIFRASISSECEWGRFVRSGSREKKDWGKKFWEIFHEIFRTVRILEEFRDFVKIWPKLWKFPMLIFSLKIDFFSFRRIKIQRLIEKLC